GETVEIYEFVRAAELGIVDIRLEKEHNDYLRAGREITVKAIAQLDTGELEDITRDVHWFSEDSSRLALKDDGIFIALPVSATGTVVVRAEFAGMKAREEVTISVAKLQSLEIGFAKSGVDGQCRISSSQFH